MKLSKLFKQGAGFLIVSGVIIGSGWKIGDLAENIAMELERQASEAAEPYRPPVVYVDTGWGRIRRPDDRTINQKEMQRPEIKGPLETAAKCREFADKAPVYAHAIPAILFVCLVLINIWKR